MTSEQMQAIRESVQSGEFATTSEAIRDAVRVWQRQRIEDAECLEAVRARILAPSTTHGPAFPQMKRRQS